MSGVCFLLSCQEQCDVREHARVYRAKIAVWDPKMPVKAGKKQKNGTFLGTGS